MGSRLHWRSFVFADIRRESRCHARRRCCAPSVHRGDLKFSERFSTLFLAQAVCPPPDRSHAACFYLFAGSIAGELERASPFSSLLRRRRRR